MLDLVGEPWIQLDRDGMQAFYENAHVGSGPWNCPDVFSDLTLRSGAGDRLFLGVETAASLPTTHGKRWGASAPHLFPLLFGKEAESPPKIDDA
jgi:hypothetical protein